MKKCWKTLDNIIIYVIIIYASEENAQKISEKSLKKVLTLNSTFDILYVHFEKRHKENDL